MAAYGTTQNFDKPLAGDTRAVGATKLDLILDSLETTLSAKVTPSGMDINANLSMRSGSTYSAIVDASKLNLRSAAALAAATHPTSVYADADGELWYNDADSNAVQLTSGGNVAAAAGNIATTGSPAYAASSVALQWDAADGYHFYGDGGVPADVFVEALRLVDGVYNIGLLAPTLASSYELTLPAALPASTSVLQVSATGAVSASPAGNIATTGTVATGALTVTGAASVSTTLSVTGLITATAGLTAAANAHVTVSGTGKFKHGSRRLTINPLGFGFGTSYTNNGGQVEFTSSAGSIYVSLALEVGCTIEAVSVYWEPAGTGSKSMTIYKRTENGTQSSIGTRTFTTSSESDYAVTLTPDAEPVVLDDTSYYILIGAGDTGDLVRTVIVQYRQD
jgi:hypothetical protein